MATQDAAGPPPAAAVGRGADRAATLALLRPIELFAGLSDAALEVLVGAAETVTILGGEVLMRQGGPADCLYVLQTGRLQVTVRRDDGTEGRVGLLGRGEVVGEMAIIADEARAATVRADRDCELVGIPARAFDQLVAADPVVLRRITTQVIERMRRSLQAAPAPSPRSTVTVVTLSDHPSVVQTAVRLGEAIAARVPGATIIARGDPRAALGTPTIAGTDGSDDGSGHWVADLERHHPLVVFTTDHEHEAWTRRCTRQSDLVLLVAEGRGATGLRPVEPAIMDRQRSVGARVELVLVRPAWAEDARGTRAWLLPRRVDAHHHVRDGDQRDVARVARLATGQAVSLVLSGGGARGISQVGVIRACHELGIPIDAVGGTSIGSLVGCLVARGWPWERIERALRIGVAEGRLIGPTIPLVSLSSAHRITQRLRQASDDLDVEDLHVDYFCMSTNLSRKEAKVHRTGPIWRAVRASLAIPGLFPPVPEGGDVLVDGGLLENFPVGRMRGLHPGASVVGVDVGARRDLPAAGLSDSCELPAWAGVKALAGRRSRDHEVSLARVLARVAELGLQPERTGAPDVVVEPPVQDLAILEFDRFDELVERGYAEGHRVLSAWLEEPGAPSF